MKSGGWFGALGGGAGPLAAPAAYMEQSTEAWLQSLGAFTAGASPAVTYH